MQLFGHESVSVLDGGLEKWISNGLETTNMMMKKKVKRLDHKFPIVSLPVVHWLGGSVAEWLERRI